MNSPIRAEAVCDDEESDKSEKNCPELPVKSESPSACSEGEDRSQQAESETSEEDDSEEVLDSREKFLIFTMGSRTYTPHQIGNGLFAFRL